MSVLPFMHWYPRDYLADTTHLTRDQHGGYFLLLQTMWLRGGKLPDDDQQLAQIVQCSSQVEWAELRKILAPFFKIARGFWHQKRLSAEYLKAKQQHDGRSAGGKSAMAKRWQKDKPLNNPDNSSLNKPVITNPKAKAEAELSPPLYPPPSLRRGGGRANRTAKKSPREVQTEAFYHVALERRRDC